LFCAARVLPIGCLALLAGLSHGPAWAWAVAALGCMLLVSCTPGSWRRWPHGSTLRRAAEFPKAGGAWGEILRKLAQTG
jgi:hypothetical protein